MFEELFRRVPDIEVSGEPDMLQFHPGEALSARIAIVARALAALPIPAPDRMTSSLQDPDRFQPWLGSIARNAALDYHRTRARRRTTSADEGTDPWDGELNEVSIGLHVARGCAADQDTHGLIPGLIHGLHFRTAAECLPGSAVGSPADGQLLASSKRCAFAFRRFVLNGGISVVGGSKPIAPLAKRSVNTGSTSNDVLPASIKTLACPQIVTRTASSVADDDGGMSRVDRCHPFHVDRCCNGSPFDVRLRN